jgi:triosephosphate isomerase (TIM)
MPPGESMIVINFKNYKRGKAAMDLARTIYLYCNNAIVAVPSMDVKDLVQGLSNLTVYAQHADYHDTAKSTGFIVPESLEETGAKGTLLNHSEHPLPLAVIKKTVKRCNERNIKVILCAKNLTQVKSFKSLNPYAIAFEDPKLIASGKSITQAKSATIGKFVEILKDTQIIPMCGAGITSATDIEEAYFLGCKGVLMSSAIADSHNPEKILKEISPYAHSD